MGRCMCSCRCGFRCGGGGFMTSPLSVREAKTIARILKVNHAGEYGAIRIYKAQVAVAQKLYPELVGHLSEMLGHELEHCASFRAAMPSRLARPCRIMTLWGMGGSVLGFVTAVMGRQAIWTCTAAVEAAVHRHLDDQLFFLAGRDPELHKVILDIREEELAHLNTAESNIEGSSILRRALRAVISWLTDVMIWLSTWGDSTRMARELAESKCSPQ
jgi:3-demethoxyubiquinol 3-hydroxylase